MTYAHSPDSGATWPNKGLLQTQVYTATNLWGADDTRLAQEGYYAEDYQPLSQCATTYPTDPTLDASSPPQAVYTPVPLSDEDCASLKQEEFKRAVVEKIQQITITRDAHLNGWLWGGPAPQCWYSIGRVGDYMARMSRLAESDSEDPANAPHQATLTCVVNTGPQPGQEGMLSLVTPDGLPKQIQHSVADIQSMLDIGEPHIDAAWGKWTELVNQAALATTKEDLDAVVWT